MITGRLETVFVTDVCSCVCFAIRGNECVRSLRKKCKKVTISQRFHAVFNNMFLSQDSPVLWEFLLSSYQIRVI